MKYQQRLEVGVGAVIVSDITESGTYIGVQARRV
jgi:serine acetyltransferase